MRVTRRVLAEIGLAGVGLAAFGPPAGAQAQGQGQPAMAKPPAAPPMAEATPFLQIETGAHVARTSAVGTDAAGRLLITGSDDKTARLWSLPDLRPLGVLRPPLGPERDGAIYGLAVSPDGRLAAIGGWFGANGRGGVLVFDLVTRQVVRHLTEVANVVSRLAISPDGTLVAAGIGGRGGLVVWRLADGALQWRDTDYAAAVSDVAFAPNGKLATTTADAGLRLYDTTGQRLQKIGTTVGRLPFGLAFSPDGKRLTVSYTDVLALEVRDSLTLAVLAQPSLDGVNLTGTTSVAWSPDSTTLFAGARSDAPNGPRRRPIYAWGAQGSGPRRELAHGFSNAVGGLRALPGGNVVFMSLSGDIAVVDAAGRPLAERLGGAGVLRRTAGVAASQRLPVSPNGQQVAWAFEPTPERWQHFDAAAADLVVGEPPAGNLVDSTDRAAGLVMSDWAASLEPRLNGKVLPLGPGQRTQAVAVSGGRALLGATWNLMLFGADGARLWSRPVLAQPLRVNLSADGRLAVSAHNDGTIRWWRAADGAEMLALFVTPDASRWVAWTPGSYYAASPGGEDLIGWHVNRGLDRAGDFFPGSRFRDRYYRPDVVRLVLATLDEAKALEQANATRRQTTREIPLTVDLPAIVTILDPAEDALLAGATATIAISVRSPSGAAVSQVVTLLDGSPAVGVGAPQPMATPPDAAAHGERYFSLTLPVPPGRPSLLAVRADTTTREGLVATRRLRGMAIPAGQAPAAPAVADPAAVLPRLNALLVGISDYANPAYRTGVGFAAKDAADLAELLRGQAQRSLFRNRVKVQVLADAQATRGAVLDGLQALRAATRPDDVTVVSFAGHGVLDEGATHFMPQDGDVERLASSAVDPAQLGGLIAGLHGRVLVLFDICHAGNAMFAANRTPDMSGLVNQMRKPGAGVMVLAATPASENAIEVPGGQNGAFTDAVLRALRGGAQADAEGLVYTDQLIAYSKQWMRQTYKRNPISYPLDPNLPDFPLLALR